MISIDDIDRFTLDSGFFGVSLDETKKPARSAHQTTNTLNDFSFNDITNIWDISSVFFCTFTYSSTACFPKKSGQYKGCTCAPINPVPYDPDEVQFIGGKIIMPSTWRESEQRVCKCPLSELSKLTPYWDMTFKDQYELFRKHFKKWVNAMNKVLDIYARISGYEVIIELTEKGILHAHSKVYSKCKYKEGFGSTAGTIWAQIAKGKVSAMSKAFEPVRNLSGLNAYMRKVQNKII